MTAEQKRCLLGAWERLRGSSMHAAWKGCMLHSKGLDNARSINSFKRTSTYSSRSICFKLEFVINVR